MKKKVIDAEAWLRQCNASWMNYNLAKHIIARAPCYEVEEEHLTPMASGGQAAPAPAKAEKVCRCRTCGAEIKWLRLPSGKKMPCDVGAVRFRPDASAVGSFVTEKGAIVRGAAVADGEPGEIGYVSHFTTCPQAGEFRRDKK